MSQNQKPETSETKSVELTDESLVHITGGVMMGPDGGDCTHPKRPTTKLPEDWSNSPGPFDSGDR